MPAAAGGYHRPSMTDWLRPLEPGGRPKSARPAAGRARHSITFERGVERFAEQYTSRKTGRPFSVTSKRNVLDNLLGSPLTAYRSQHGIRTIDQWNGDVAADYLRWLQHEMRRDSATVKKVRGQLRSFAEFCRHELRVPAAAGALATLRVSPENDFDRPKDPPLTHAEAEALLKAAPTSRDELAIAMLLYTGMLPSEMLALDEGHVRLDRTPPVIEVRASLHTAHLSEGDHRFRDVPLTVGQTMLPKLLRSHLADPERPANAAWIFLSKRGDRGGGWRPLTLEGLRAMLYDLSGATSIKCNAHRLRHTFCTWCAAAGVQMTHLQQLLGHKDSDMVASYYRGKTNRTMLEATARVRF